MKQRLPQICRDWTEFIGSFLTNRWLYSCLDRNPASKGSASPSTGPQTHLFPTPRLSGSGMAGFHFRTLRLKVESSTGQEPMGFQFGKASIELARNVPSFMLNVSGVEGVVYLGAAIYCVRRKRDE